MSTWTLVLVLFWYGRVTSVSIPDYDHQTLCGMAGDSVIERTAKVSADLKVLYICVEVYHPKGDK